MKGVKGSENNVLIELKNPMSINELIRRSKECKLPLPLKTLTPLQIRRGIEETKLRGLVVERNGKLYLTPKGKAEREKLVNRLAMKSSPMILKLMKSVNFKDEDIFREEYVNEYRKFYMAISNVLKEERLCWYTFAKALKEVYGNSVKNVMLVALIGSNIALLRKEPGSAIKLLQVATKLLTL